MKRRTRHRSQQERNERSVKSSRREFKGIQIVVKVDNSNTSMTDATPSDKVSDITRKIPYVTFEGRVLRRSDYVKTFGTSDGSTLQVPSEFRGGGQRKEKKSKAEKKQVTGQESVSDNGSAILECERDE